MSYLDKILNGDGTPDKNPLTGSSYFEQLLQNQPNINATDVQLGQYGVGETDYDIGVNPTNVDYLNEIRAQGQSSLAKLGSGLVNTVTQTSLDIIKDASYLVDFENYLKFEESSREGFQNWLADAITSVQKKVKLPVYRTTASEGFSPLSWGWWADNMPSIASTVAMAVPAELAVSGLSKIGKVLGGRKVINSIEAATGVKSLGNTAEAVTSAFLSRQMENILEAGSTFEETKASIKEKNPNLSEEEVNRIAGEAAVNNYKANWVNIVTDIPQFMLLHKSFKQSMDDMKFSSSKLLKTMGQESVEEAYQYISNEESKRSALINSKILEDDGSSLKERLSHYAKDGEFWTAAFLGGLGGGLFSGVASFNDKRNAPIIQAQYEALAKMHASLVKGDEESFNRTSDDLFAESLMSNIKHGSVDSFKKLLNDTETIPENNEDLSKTRITLKNRNDIIDKAIQYKDKLASDNSKSSVIKALELDTFVRQKLAESRLNNIDNNLNILYNEDRQLLNLEDQALYQFKLLKLEYEAIKDLEDFKVKSKDLLSSIDSSYDLIINEGVYKNKEDIDKKLISTNDKALIDLLRNKAIETNLINNSKEILYNISDPLKREELEKKQLDESERIKKSEEKAAKEEAKKAEQEAEDLQITEDEIGIVTNKQQIYDKYLKALDTTPDKFGEFQTLFDDLMSERHLFDKAEIQALLDKRTILLDEVASSQEPIDVVNLNDVKDATSGPSNQDFVSEGLSNDTLDNTEAKDQDNLNTDNNRIAESADSKKGIKSVINDIMMRLFKHFYEDNKFRFQHGDDGLPILQNNSDINIKALNDLKVKDKVKIVLYKLNKEAEAQYSVDKENSLKDKYVSSEDFDDVHLAILDKDNNLLGFVRQPHSTRNAENRTDAERIRRDLINYRRSVIAKLNAGEEVTETILDKGNGNLYTKLKTDGTNRIDATRNVLKTAREQDRIKGALVFVHTSTDGGLVLPRGLESNFSKAQETYFNNILAKYGKIFKSGKVFQLVKNISGSWSIIPVYANMISDRTANDIVKVIGTFNDNADYMKIVEALNSYIYASVERTNAALYIFRNEEKEVILKINGEEFTLNELKTNADSISSFVKELKTKRQNIDTNKINNIKYQEELADRDAFMSNVMTYEGEYFVQPYVEYSQTIADTQTQSDRVIDTVDLTDVDDSQNKPVKGKYDVEDADPDDVALSTTKDNTPLRRKHIDKWLAEHLPQFSVADAEAIAQLKLNLTDVYGMFKDQLIYLFSEAGNKTAYHEAFHGVFRNLLDRNQRHAVIQEAFNRYERPSQKDILDLQDRFPKATVKQATYLYYEEKLADEFAEYINSYETRSIGQRIIDFFNKILSLFGLYSEQDQSTIDELFSRIKAKEFKTAEVKIAKPDAIDLINRPFEHFVNDPAYSMKESKRLDKVFGSSTVKYNVISNIGNEFLARYQRYLLKGEHKDPTVIFQDILNLYRKFADKGVASNDITKDVKHAMRIADNFPEILSEVKKYMSLRGVNINQEYKWLDNNATNVVSDVVDESKPDIEESEGVTEEAIAESQNESEELSDTTLASRMTKGLGEFTSISGITSSSTRLKLFLSSIPVLKDGEEVTDIYGIPQYYDFSRIYYYIERNLTGLYTFDEQMIYLNELSNYRPELKSVMEKLGVTVEVEDIANDIYKVNINRPSSLSKEEHDLIVNDFKTNFSKQQMVYTLAQFVSDKSTGTVSYKIFDANRRGIGREILSQWDSNLIDPNRDTIAVHNAQDGIITIHGTDKADNLYNKWDELKSKKSISKNDIQDILSKIGIEFSPELLDNLSKNTTNDFKNKLTKVLEWYKTDNPNDTLDKDGRIARGALVLLETNTQFNAYTQSFNNVENKNIYTVQLPSYASKLMSKLTSSDRSVRLQAVRELKKDVFYEDSNLLNDILSDDIYATQQFKLSYLDGLKDGIGESKGSKFTNMTTKDFILLQLALFNNKSTSNNSSSIFKHMYITPSDKTLAQIFDLKKYRVNFKIEDKKRIVERNSPIVGAYYNIFLQEIKRIKRANDLKEDILKNRDNASVQLNDLLQYYHISTEKGAWDRFSEYAKRQANSVNKPDQKLTDADWKDIESLLSGQTFKFNYFTSGFRSTLSKTNMFDIIKNTDIKNLENAIESTIVKEASGLSLKDTVLSAIQVELRDEIEATLKEFRDKNIIEIEDGLYKSTGIELTSSTAEDINNELLETIASFSLNTRLANIELSNILNGDYATYKPDDLQKRTYQSQSMFTNNNFSRKYANVRVVKDVKADYEYSSDLIEGLKSIGYSEEEARDMAAQYKDNNVTDAQVFITPEFWEELHRSRGTWTPAKAKARDIAEGKIKPVKLDADIRLELEALKTFYYGSRFDDTLGIMRYEQVKCSMMPLFKCFRDINPLLDMKYKEMKTNQEDILAFESTFKAAIGFRDDIIDDDGITLPLDLNNLGIQVDNPQHIQDVANESLRQLKMLILGSIDIEKSYNGKPGQEIVNEISNLEAANIREALNELLSRIDGDNKNFIQYIKEMVTKRGATINVEELLEIVDNDFKYPLDNGNMSRSMENMISSIFTRKVIRQAFDEGGSAVQATSLGLNTNYKNLKDQQANLTDRQLLLQQELKWIKPDAKNGVIGYAEAYMPAWTKRFFDKNGYLKDINTIPDALKEIIVYRIPTEGLHSMMPVRVKGFLPEAMGNSMLLPYEVTKQFGSDFDFDKTYFIAREFYIDDKGMHPYEYITGDSKDDTLKRYNQYYNYNKVNKKDIVPFNTFKEWSIPEQNVKGARNNGVVDNYLKLLTSIENLDLIIKPSGFENIEKIKKLLFETDKKGKYTKTDPSLFFSSITQRDYKDRNHTGIALKGQSALHVSGHSYAVRMNLTSESYSKEGELIKSNCVNFNGENRYDFSTLYTTDGNLIADELASIMAAILDDIKKPILATLGINKHTIDVLCTIVRSGYSMDTALRFVSQPGIKELSNYLDVNYNKVKVGKTPRVDVNNLISEYDNILKDLIDKAEKEGVYTPELEKDVKKSEYSIGLLTDKDMEDFIVKHGFKEPISKKENLQNKIFYYAFQKRILTEFANIENISKDLVNINKFFAINKEVGPNVENIIAKREILDNINNAPYITGFNISDIPTLEATWEAQEAALNYLEKYFPYSTPLYMDIKQSIVSVQDSKTLDQIPIDTRIKMNSFIRAFMDTMSGSYFSNNRSRFAKIYKDLPILLSNIKSGKEVNKDKKLGNVSYETIRNNLFIKELEVKFNDKSRMWNITQRGHTLDLQVKNAIIESFKSLYNNNNTKDLAKQLIDYSFAYNGFYGGVMSYHSLIPVEVLDDLGYTKYRKDLIENLRNNSVSLSEEEFDRIIDQMVRNHPKEFTKVFDKDMFDVVSKSVIKTTPDKVSQLKRTKDFLIGGSKDEGFKTPRYIRVFDNQSKEMVMYKNIPDTYSYEYVDMLGVNGRHVEIDALNDIVRSGVRANWKGTVNTTNEETDETETEPNVSSVNVTLNDIPDNSSEQTTVEKSANIIKFEEEKSSGYRERTIKNASADATIAIAIDFNSAGEKLTKSSVLSQNKMYIPINANNLEVTEERVDKIIDLLNSIKAKTLNIAGNGIYTMKGKYNQGQIDKFTYELLKAVIESEDLETKIVSIRTGGQTGFDEAGAKAGLALGIPTMVLAPKGWKFRDIDGRDISDEKAFKSRFGEIKPNQLNLFNDFNLTDDDISDIPDDVKPC